MDLILGIFVITIILLSIKYDYPEVAGGIIFIAFLLSAGIGASLQ